MSRRADTDAHFRALRSRVPAAQADPEAFLRDLAADFEDIAEGPEDDVRIVRAARSTARALVREADRWRKVLR